MHNPGRAVENQMNSEKDFVINETGISMGTSTYYLLSKLNLALPFLLLILSFGCGSSIQLKNLPLQNNTICCFGDSLVYGVGAKTPEESYPSILKILTNRDVSSWGTPGDTTEQALLKCAEFENHQFGMVIVTIGGNDILQRVRWEKTEKNLRLIFQKIQSTGAVVVFTGVTGPLNPTRNKLYRKICKKEGVHYIPEILDGITNDPALRADEVHPNSQGYKIMAERIVHSLKKADLL